MKVETNHFYDFGPFRIDIAERVLLQDGRPVHLTNKSFDVLVALIERSGHVVGKDELIEKVWPDCFVEEGNLAVTVSMLRKVLEAGGEGDPYIETVPRRGYRFIAEVREISSDGSRPTPFEDERKLTDTFGQSLTRGGD